MSRPEVLLLAALYGSEGESWPERLATVALGAAGVVAGWAGWAAARSSDAHRSPDAHERRAMITTGRTWLAIAAVLIGLGLSKHLGVHTWLLDHLRKLSRNQGWYERRRDYQTDFIIASLVVGALAMVAIARLLRNAHRDVVAAAATCGCLVMLVMVRAVSFHNIDRFVATYAGGQFDVLVQFAGSTIIVTCVAHWFRRTVVLS